MTSIQTVFVVPLKNLDIAQNPTKTTALTLRCLKSIFNQTSNNYKIILVCNSFPYKSTSDQLHIIQGDFARPMSYEECMTDKYNKLYAGLTEAKQYAPCYIMKLDADDMIHRNLLRYMELVRKDIYVIDKGYKYIEGRNTIDTLNRFHFACGSSSIVHTLPDELPKNLLFGGHHKVEEFYLSQGKELHRIPFRSAIYSVGHLENHSGSNALTWKSSRKKYLLNFLNRRYLSKKIRNIFALEDLQSIEYQVLSREMISKLPLIPL